jgi:type IV pilus secretin PilQ/predicted competence protein
MMRKQWMAIIFLLLFSTASFAVGTELAGIDVDAAHGPTVITLRASGMFTHREYTPTSSLIFVDLTGVSPAQFSNAQKEFSNVAGIAAYRVSSYKDARGAQVTRIEMTLRGEPTVAIREVPNGVALKLEVPRNSTTTVAHPKTAAAPVPAPAPAAPAAPQSARIASVENVSIARNKDSVDVEITGDSPLAHQEMIVPSPERLVIDIPNSEPATEVTRIAVNLPEARSVRIGRFQENPPVTRVVVDLGANVQYNVSASGSKVFVHLHSTAAHALPAASQPATALAGNRKPEPETSASLQKPTPPPAPAVSAGPAMVIHAGRSTSAPAIRVKQAPPATLLAANAEKPPLPDVMQKPALVLAARHNSNTVQAAPAVKVVSAPPSTLTSATAQMPAAPSVAAKPQPRGDGEQDGSAIQPQQAIQSTRQAVSQAETAASAPQAPVSAPVNPNAAVNLAREQQQMMAQPQPVAGNRTRYSGEPIWVNLKDADLKDFFRLIHEISGLNIVLDPNVHGSLTLVLDAVPWDQALDIVLQNNQLDKQIEGNVLRIATVDTLRKEADAVRAREEAQAMAVNITTYTHYLSYAHSKDVIPIVKKFLSTRGDATADERSNAVIVRDIPSTLPEIQRLLTSLDRKTQEVEIEARVVAATRNFVRDIGTQLGFGWGNSTTHLGGAPQAGLSPAQLGYLFPPPYLTSPGVPLPTGTPTLTPASIPLFSNLGLSAPTSGLSLITAIGSYRLDALLTMAESKGLLKILSRPRVVTQNNIQALVRQGVRVPVVTQSQLGGPPTVTYFDAFLRLTVTPQITAEGTVFLNVEVENTTPDFSRTVQGNPTMVTQQAQTNVLVANGGTVVIGGVIQTTNSVNISQVPLLGDIPILGNAFKHRSVSTSTQELIFFITPKIIET